ncbi:hypothetical protein [Mucilaginibacter lacusdianchii]|uniref:hypothetical protein n=1 Tax=Mucilaginibacter lacusdianchii TaxID=2684211 RepID=UPI00131BCB0F|nr:hypothetical protein [Mucilaginibacter sp. JXJ CY 39]
MASAQLATALKGVILKERTTTRAAEVRVTNLQNKAIVQSDNLGFFSILANVGDTLLFTKTGYADQKIAITSTQDLIVRMMTNTELGPVVIRGTTKKQEMQETMDIYRSKGIYFNGKPPALAAVASPITGLYELFGKGPGQARRFSNYMQKESKEIEIDKRYNKALVKRITELPDEDVDKFMLAYRPAYDDLKKWTDYDLIVFIKKSAASYKDAKDTPGLQRLY